MRTVVITGLEHFAKKMVEDLRSYNSGLKIMFVKPKLSLFTVYNLIRSDIIHFIGGWIFITNSKWKSFLFKLLSLRKRIIIHWVGSDVLQLYEVKHNVKIAKNSNIYHLCEVEWIYKELKNKNIFAEIMPILGFEVSNLHISNWPKKFSILTYLGKNREEFYGLNEILTLSRKLPFIEIEVIGTKCENCRIKKVPPNIKFHGWVSNVKELMLKHPIYIRYVKHDGLSISVLEALSLGRHVCYNFPLQGCYYTPNIEKLANIIKELYKKYTKGQLRPNYAGIDLVRKKYSHEEVYKKIIKYYLGLLK